LLVTLAGWVNRHQQHVIEYLVEENRVLKGQLEGRRLRLTDDRRRRLAAKGRPVPVRNLIGAKCRGGSTLGSTVQGWRQHLRYGDVKGRQGRRAQTQRWITTPLVAACWTRGRGVR
jgi:hypothetical protein